MKKLFIGLLAFIGLGLLNFGSCENVVYTGTINSTWTVAYGSDFYVGFPFFYYQSVPLSLDNIGLEILDFKINGNSVLPGGSGNANVDGLYVSTSTYNFRLIVLGCSNSNDGSACNQFNSTTVNNSSSVLSTSIGGRRFGIVGLGIPYRRIDGSSFSCSSANPCSVSFSFVFTYNSDYKIFFVGDTLNSSCTSSYCQSEYNLIPISSVDTNYCQINNLCPGSSLPCVGSGNSNVYIFKDNQYIPITGSTNIFVNLPEFLNYSYEYSNGGNDLDIDLNYNVDSQYISSVIDNQKTLPNNTDFNNIIVGILPLFVPGLIIILFIYFVFKLLKKIF